MYGRHCPNPCGPFHFSRANFTPVSDRRPPALLLVPVCTPTPDRLGFQDFGVPVTAGHTSCRRPASSRHSYSSHSSSSKGWWLYTAGWSRTDRPLASTHENIPDKSLAPPPQKVYVYLYLAAVVRAAEQRGRFKGSGCGARAAGQVSGSGNQRGGGPWRRAGDASARCRQFDLYIKVLAGPLQPGVVTLGLLMY